MKIGIISNGPLHMGGLASASLSDHFDSVSIVYCNEKKPESNYFHPKEELYGKYYIDQDSFVDNLKSYDVVIGLEHSCCDVLAGVKEREPQIKVGVQVLDFPKHTFVKTKDYNEFVLSKWEKYYFDFFQYLDFVFHNQQIAFDEIKKYHPNAASKVILHPIFPIEVKDYKRKNFIVYSGASNPAKGLHYVISALGLVEAPIEFIAIGSGSDLSSYGKFLNVSCRFIENLSEEEKWKMYHESRFLVCGADNPYIPALCILEGISIKRSGIVFDYPENRIHYGDNVYYCPPRNIGLFAKMIDSMYSNSKETDEKAAKGRSFCEKVSYKNWGEEVSELIKGAITRNG